MEISCVIPTFENVDLAARCLASAAGQREVAMEIIVTDDSRSEAVARLVEAMAPSWPTVRRIAGARTGNAVDNWNHGLGEARAPLRLMLHQDEFLADPLYLRRAVDRLRDPALVATIAGVSVIALRRASRFALARRLADTVGRPAWVLPVLNWIGPTATIVFRGDLRFDPSLVALVDIDFYLRLLRSGPVAILPGISVGSLGHHGAQISARIDPLALARREIAAMAARPDPVIDPRLARLFDIALAARMALR